MKIGMLVNNLTVSGGYQKLVIRFSQTLQNMGHTVVVYTPQLDKKKCYPDDINTITVVDLPPEQGNITPVEAYGHLVKKIDTDLDALVIHDELSLLGVALLKKRPKRIAWMLNNQFPEELGKYKTEVKSVYKQTVGPLKTKIAESKKAARRVKLLRAGLRAVNHFATYDEYNKTLVERFLKRPATVVSAGADLDRFRRYAGSRTFKKKSAYSVLSVGVAFPHRRYEDLIEAMAILKKQKQPITATIVGRQDLAPDYFKKLESLTRKLGVEKQITFKNYVTDKEMVSLYKASDAFAFINDGFTWGISVFEAVAAKLPVIITSNIGAADLVKTGKTGWVVQPQSPKEVAKAIVDITKDPSATEKIATTAQDTLTPFVSWEAYTKRMLALLDK